MQKIFYPLKKAFAIVLSIILLIPSLGTLVVFTSFKINQAEISKTICEQKASINNSCNGRCELQKSLKKLEDNEKEMSNHLDKNVEFLYILQKVSYNFSQRLIIKNCKPSNFQINSKPTSVSFAIFHPPTA